MEQTKESPKQTAYLFKFFIIIFKSYTKTKTETKFFFALLWTIIIITTAKAKCSP